MSCVGCFRLSRLHVRAKACATRRHVLFHSFAQSRYFFLHPVHARGLSRPSWPSIFFSLLPLSAGVNWAPGGHVATERPAHLLTNEKPTRQIDWPGSRYEFFEFGSGNTIDQRLHGRTTTYYEYVLARTQTRCTHSAVGTVPRTLSQLSPVPQSPCYESRRRGGLGAIFTGENHHRHKVRRPQIISIDTGFWALGRPWACILIGIVLRVHNTHHPYR